MAVKKQENKTITSQPVEKALSRRSFFRTGRNWIFGVILLEVIAVTIAFLGFGRKKRPDDSEWSQPVDAGRASDYEENSVTYFRKGGFFLARMSDGGFIALSMACPHLGCSVQWDDPAKRFNCPCHSSAFDIKGNVVASPATRPMDYFPVRIKGGKITVDVARSVQRNYFDKKQAAYD